MKLAIVLIGLSATICTWWWIGRQNRGNGAPTLAQQIKKGVHSILAGIVVYFCLVLAALIYLMITT